MSDTREVTLGPVEKVPMGQGFCFKVDGEEIAVFRQRDGRLFATQNRCPHKQGPLSEGIIGSGRVVCPLHSHKFDLSTGEGEHRECLRTYPLRVENGSMILTVPVKAEAPVLACK